MSPKGKNKKILVLLDSHAIIHRAYHALPEFTSSKGEPTGALYGLSSMLMRIISDIKPDYVVACYDLPQKTFRHEAYDGYKAGRAKTDEALVAQLKNSRKIFEAFNIPMYDMPGFEADDMLGTIVEQMKKEKDLDIIIASGDMDTMQLVDDKKVQVYTLKKGINDTILYDEKAVVERYGFMPKLLPDYKGLRGDPSDNIIGIKGVGEKTATDLIKNFGTIENMYKVLKKDPGAFSKAGISERMFGLLKDNEEEALFSKTLALIRRDAPIQFVLPKKEFEESLDIKKVEDIFTGFDFRSLMSRMKNLFNKNLEVQPNFRGSASKSEEKKSEENVDSNELMETSIALWLLNSDITNPSFEDIMLSIKEKDFENAKKAIFTRLKKEGLEKVFEEIEKPIIHIVDNMERRGILIDKKFFKKLSEEYHKELDKLSEKIKKMAGMDFNINSPKQLGEVLFEKLGMKSKKKRGASGSFSTKIEVLEGLADENPIIKEIVAYRELQKLLSTYIDVIPALVAEDGRLHAKFIQHGTTTGRFSSQNPNLQNIPIRTDLGKKIREGFIAEKGTKLVAFDYSQIELRIMAILSKDKNLVQIFKNGKDVHTGVASIVFGVPEEKVDQDMRRKAKVINFGIIYGMGVTLLAKNLGLTRAEAQKFHDEYFEKFSGVREYLENTKRFAEEHIYTETIFGRRRQFPGIRSKIPFIKNMAERTATNAPLQGTQSDIIKLAIRFAEDDLQKAGLLNKTHLILQIHDELVYEIEESALKKSSKIIENAMENVLDRSFIHYKSDIPILVHYGFGDNLGEVK